MNKEKKISKKENGPRLRKQKSQWDLIMMTLPGFILVLIFSYVPVYGMLIAFQDYNPAQGFLGSPWVGLKHFMRFFRNPMAFRTFKNTIVMSLSYFPIYFVLPLVLALMINEIRSQKFKKFIQSVSCFSYFVSLVVVVGLLKNFCTQDGLFNRIIVACGGDPIRFFSKPEWFLPLYTLVGLWMTVGWNSIVYLATICNISPDLYEAASLDGAGRWTKMFHITLPALKSQIITLLLFNMACLLNFADTQRVLLMYSPQTYKTADIIGTLVYREGIAGHNYSYAAAVDMMMIVITSTILIVGNRFARKHSETSLY